MNPTSIAQWYDLGECSEKGPMNTIGYSDFSLWDRLNLEEEDLWSPRRGQPEDNWKLYLRRDIEDLLNTRRPPTRALQEYRLTAESVFNFGLPDLTMLNLHSGRDRSQACKVIETALRLFEPRLTAVAVSTDPPDGLANDTDDEKSLLVAQFYVDALVLVGREKRRFRFRTEVQRDRARFVINETR
jgi:type VI secretion system lysozyme-like protein